MAEARLSSFTSKTMAEALSGGALFPATMGGANINVPASEIGGGVPYTFTPGTTTYGEILAALDAGKTFVHVYAPSGGALLKTYYTGMISSTLNGVSRILLASISQTVITFYTITDDDTWAGPTTVAFDVSGKVAVASGEAAGYLSDVLVSDSDLVSLVKVGGQLRVQLDLDHSADPKISTMDESQVDSATSNYGAYALKEGADRLVWGDTEYGSYDYLNASVHQCTRLAAAQGTITKCNLALCGSLSYTAPAVPCFNVGIFDMQGNLLGQSGLRFYGTDFGSGEELCEVDMTEESTGSLSIRRNTRYVIQVWTCGLQLAALDRHDTYNYTFDYTLRQNLEGTTSQPAFVPVDGAMNRADKIPFVSFGAASLA